MTAPAASLEQVPPLGVYIEDDAKDEPTVWLHVPIRPESPIALLKQSHAEESGVRLLWTFLAQALPSHDEVLIECPVCEGAGEITVCLNDGTHGCSHQFDREFRCAACTGGTVKLADTESPSWCDQCGLSNACHRCAA